MTAQDKRRAASPAPHHLRPTTRPGRRALHALGASGLFLVASAVILNTAGQGLAATLLGAASAVFALACFVLAGIAVIRDGERSPLVFSVLILSGLVLAVVLHPLVVND